MGFAMQLKTRLDPRFAANVARWARGEITWAQVEGFTSKQAGDFAKAGYDLARRGQYKKAAVIFEGLIAMNPYDHASRAALGAVYQRLGRVADAVREYDQAVAINGRNVVALANRGELRIQRGDVRGAEDLRRAVEIDARLSTASAKRARSVLASLRHQA
jgi:Flp pilus assembly protein TadD